MLLNEDPTIFMLAEIQGFLLFAGSNVNNYVVARLTYFNLIYCMLLRIGCAQQQLQSNNINNINNKNIIIATLWFSIG